MVSLQQYAGPASKHTCPQCGRSRCFTLYVDENGQPINELVGYCDHRSACGYHYPPKAFYRDHPELKPAKDWRDERPEWLDKPQEKPHILPRATHFIPDHIVQRSVRPDKQSDFTTFLSTLLDPIVVESLVVDYRLGVTSRKDVIFFQLDVNGRCRTGKIMKYDPETGHRIKDENTPGRITWVHSLMKYSGMLPPEWTLTQCLFGEHLLAEYPDKVVALVESEKTAVICAGLMPKYLWLATGGKSAINDRLLVLKGRNVQAFPDIDGYDEWQRKLSEFPQLGVTINPILQQNATPEDIDNHIDIADWLIRYRFQPAPTVEPRVSPDFFLAAKYLSPEAAPEVEALINDLGLMFIKAEKIEEND
jgi:hypothetical protein